MTMIHHYWTQGGYDDGIAHEMSHHWWGEKTTCLDWRNIWLNEGFADFSDELYTYHEQGRAAFQSLMADRAAYYYSEEASYTRPVYDPPMAHLWDEGHTYDKASWVQYMLSSLEGDTILTQPGIFFRAMRTYSDSFQYGNANTDDYCRIHSQVTGRDLTWFFNQWIYMAGYPVYTINWHVAPVDSSYQVLVDIAQNNGAQAPTCFNMPLQLEFQIGTGDTLVTIPIDTNPQMVSLVFKGQPTALTVDPGALLLEKNTVYLGIDNATAPELAQPLAATPTIVRSGSQLRYTIGKPGRVDLAVYDGAGRKVRMLVAGNPGLGTHRVTWDGTNEAHSRVASGVYFCRLTGPQLNNQLKLVVTQ
jgi:aminopeptidase N